MDFKLELVLVPVSDVDRAKAFYTEQLGFTLDVDHAPNDDFRVVQMTPPGSASYSCEDHSATLRARETRRAGVPNDF